MEEVTSRMNHVHQFQVKRLQPSPDSNHHPFGNKSESFMDVLIDVRSMYDRCTIDVRYAKTT